MHRWIGRQVVDRSSKMMINGYKEGHVGGGRRRRRDRKRYTKKAAPNPQLTTLSITES